jgi:type III pantothenate kinase
VSAWVFDLGNSRLKVACVDDASDPGARAVSAAHDGVRFAPGWEACLPASPGVAWIASVAPPALTARLVAALRARGARVEMVATARDFAGVTVAYADPSRLGVDRLLAMAAARARDQSAALVVGVGTALTIDLVDGAGAHQGGRIAPSPALMRDALQRKVPHLPADAGGYQEFAIDTASALVSGSTGAAIALIERSRDQACTRVGDPVRVWLHGGGAAELHPWLPGSTHAPALVLEGLALWARRAGAAGES